MTSSRVTCKDTGDPSSTLLTIVTVVLPSKYKVFLKGKKIISVDYEFEKI